MKNSILFSVLAVIVLVSCGKKPDYNGALVESAKQKFGIDTISKDFINPWGMAFLPDGRTLVTERRGAIRIIQDGKLLSDSIGGVPPVFFEGQGGLLDIQLHPDYNTNGWIYLTYSKPGPDTTSATTLARTKISGNNFVDFSDIFTAGPFEKTKHHYGSRIAFDGAGHIYISSGERGLKEHAQELNNYHGKIIRLNEDGTIPQDNPFVNTAGAMPGIWSYGHRNPQGLIYDAETGLLWDTEHGPKGGDELNLVKPGKNYGWPVITYGINYDDTPITDITEKDGMEQPKRYWKPSIATGGLMKVTGERYPAWKGNFLVGALAQMHIARVELSDTTFVAEERLLEKVGRVRCVAQSPDGFIYVATEGPGALLKLVPVK